jgi:hypothetical protein
VSQNSAFNWENPFVVLEYWAAYDQENSHCVCKDAVIRALNFSYEFSMNHFPDLKHF